MQKIITLFQRNETDRLVRDDVTEGAEWVPAGEGMATIKYDGTACMILGGVLYRRHRVKEGKSIPPGWLHWDMDPEAKSGHGWVPVGDGSSDQYHREPDSSGLPDGTYELVGPMVQGNPYGLGRHELRRHGMRLWHDFPRDFVGARGALRIFDHEGIVWHHPDGRMVKIKRRDFGFDWPLKSLDHQNNNQ